MLIVICLNTSLNFLTKLMACDGVGIEEIESTDMGSVDKRVPPVYNMLYPTLPTITFPKNSEYF